MLDVYVIYVIIKLYFLLYKTYINNVGFNEHHYQNTCLVLLTRLPNKYFCLQQSIWFSLNWIKNKTWSSNAWDSSWPITTPIAPKFKLLGLWRLKNGSWRIPAGNTIWTQIHLNVWKKLRFCHKFWFPNSYFFATQCHRP